MGIPGIYKEIGPGKRVALVKLATEKLELADRPFRFAIDTSIWSFQVQAAQGGTNPALRTLYYRLLRLLSVSVQPLFVFDGANKPAIKRNRHTGRGGVSIPDMMFKQLLNYFGVSFHTAPGEAEAECALLQREGIVDAVLSEDVDTLMFGCGLTLRNWTSEVSKSKVPTHVNMYDAQVTKQGKSGLDREGMILVALLSGGDYDTEGLPGFGPGVACEAARAGFGKSLCFIRKSDAAGYKEWRENLNRELRTNESKYFRSKHKALKVPDDFPRLDVLKNYTHPIVSNERGLAKLRDESTWGGEIDVVGLRKFVGEAFEWKGSIGAKKFIRGLAPALLIHKLRLRSDRRDSEFSDTVLTAMNEMELVRSICGKRAHFSTDAMPELRVIFHPNDIVDLDLDAEEDISADYGRDGLAPLLEDDQIEAYASDDNAARSSSPTKRITPAYDPTQPEKLWIPETIAKLGIPLKVEDYEESLRDPKKLIKQKAMEKKAATRKTAAMGSMDEFVKVTKSVQKPAVHSGSSPGKVSRPSSQPNIPPTFLAPSLQKPSSSQPAARSPRTSNQSTRITKATSVSMNSTLMKSTTSSRVRSTNFEADKGVPTNPWSLSKSGISVTSGILVSKQIQKPRKSTPEPTFRHFEFSGSPSLVDISSPSPSPQAAESASSVQSSLKCGQTLEFTSHEAEEANAPIDLTSSCASPRGSSDHVGASSTVEKAIGPSPRKKRISILSSHTSITKDDTSSPNTSDYGTPGLSVPDEISVSRLPMTRRLEFWGSEVDVEAKHLPQSYTQRTLIDYFSSSPPTSSPFQASPPLQQQLPTSQTQTNHFPTTWPPTSNKISSSSRSKQHEDGDVFLVAATPTAADVRTFQEKQPKRKEKGNETAEGKGKGYLMLRESAIGTWKEVGRDDLIEGRSRAWRKSQVEVLDLTGD